MSEAKHLAAVLAAINTAGGNAYSLEQLAQMGEDLPTSYNEVVVVERLGDGPRRAGGPSAITQWRVQTRAVAQIYGNAQEIRRRAAVGLKGTVVVVDGVESTEIERVMSDDPIVPDDGWYSGTSEFGYAL